VEALFEPEAAGANDRAHNLLTAGGGGN
jgi:hypothetical protein